MCLQIQDAKAGFLVNGFVTVSATVLVLEESVQLTRDGDGSADNLRCDKKIARDSFLLSAACWCSCNYCGLHKTSKCEQKG